MFNIESSCSSNNTSKRTAAITTAFSVALALAAFVAPDVSHAAKPYPALNATSCAAMAGTWTTLPSLTCTIAPGNFGEVRSDLRILAGAKLDIQGGLTINSGVKVVNAGTILVENAGGVAPDSDLFHEYETGVLVFGTLDNSGTITVANAYDESNAALTEGITVSISATEITDTSNPNRYDVVPGTLTNSGTITIQNSGQTRGITNIGTIVNSATGAIAIENSVTTSVGLYNRRENLKLFSTFYFNGTVTNAGSMTLSNSGGYSGYGVYNQGTFMNTASGSFTINASTEPGDFSAGLWNGGSFTSYGTFTNNRGAINFENEQLSTWGSFNEAGSMINYGITNATGTFYNGSVMINLGTLTNYGILVDLSDGQTMINYGTIYNYGGIGNGVNRGMCVDEIYANPQAGGC